MRTAERISRLSFGILGYQGVNHPELLLVGDSERVALHFNLRFLAGLSLAVVGRHAADVDTFTGELAGQIHSADDGSKCRAPHCGASRNRRNAPGRPYVDRTRCDTAISEHIERVLEHHKGEREAKVIADTLHQV